MENRFKKILADHQVAPNKRLGQNFLINQSVIDRMVDLAKVSKKDQILEVGPGLGFLTESLINKGCGVVGIEIDYRLAKALADRIDSPKLKVINKDILKVDIDELFSTPFKVVSSLPYQISSPFVKKIVDLKNRPKTMILLLQLEVGRRLSALPGNSERGLLSVVGQTFYHIEVEKIVKPGSFFPQPKVDSAIVSFELREKISELDPDFLDEFIDFVGLGFRQKRKKLTNSLSSSNCYQKEKLKYL